MKIVFLTGCFGFIGGALTKLLLKSGYFVYGIDKLTSVYSEDHFIDLMYNKEYNNKFKFIEADICDLTELPDCDYVINTAAETHVLKSIECSKEFIHSNVEGVRNLLDLIRKTSTSVVDQPIFYQFSTDEVYGDIPEGIYATEEFPLNPSSGYSASKAAADLLIQAYGRTYGLKYCIIRPTNNYGKNQYPEKLIPLSIKLWRRGKKIKLHNEGIPKRYWLHVEDTCLAVKLLLENNALGIYNVGGDTEQSNLETVTQILTKLITNMKIDNFIDKGFVRPGQDYRYAVDDSKLRKLGWANTKKLSTELNSIIKWYLDPEHNRLFL